MLKLPVGEAGAKVGLDDYLCAHPVTTLDELPRLALKHPLFKRAAAWWREWSKRAEEGPARPQPSVLELLQRPDTTRVLHPAQDVADGVLWYGLPVDGALVMITSTRQACRSDQLLEGIALRHTDPGPSRVSRDIAVRWLTGGESGSVARANDGLADFFARYVVLKDGRAAFLLAAWTLATWCSRAFRVRGSLQRLAGHRAPDRGSALPRGGAHWRRPALRRGGDAPGRQGSLRRADQRAERRLRAGRRGDTAASDGPLPPITP